ncbi:hypothetical protein EGI16_03450 [Chryseobacterium sp. G0240]|uniref:hypothetical protein n=1 Tax=Chryseobacterium sp. G0240 TaxID=2487066 RepID=UPI000F453272|nr:hypothetical protein [Chryseobacterium sp. G0240]ROI05455.1 hypothetical protein EGI16_03450 [Chryseobacterium sp. G0240]
MAITPSNCQDFDLVPKESDCTIEEREVNIRSIGFYKSSTVLPYPLTAAALKELIAPADPATTKPGLVFSNELANVTFADPQVAERKVSDSRPPIEAIESREVTFQDRIAVNVTEASKIIFKDYEFWKDKKEHSTVLNYVFAMSDGRLIVPRQQNSLAGMSASFSMFLNFEAKNQGGAYEFKQGKIKFLGDPLDFVQPDINLNDIPEIKGMW